MKERQITTRMFYDSTYINLYNLRDNVNYSPDITSSSTDMSLCVFVPEFITMLTLQAAKEVAQ